MADVQQNLIRILVVDDHPLIREGLVSLIAKQPDLEICGEADGPATALELIEALSPDVAVVDLSLKDGSGLDLIKRIRARNDEIRIVVSSMHDESLFAERALHAGAMGYVNKQQGNQNLLEAIRRVHAGKIYLSEQMSNRLLSRFATVREGTLPPSVESLTNRELQVFELLGRGVTTRLIAEQLQLSPKTVERYRENIKSKLKLNNSTELVRRATQWVLENG